MTELWVLETDNKQSKMRQCENLFPSLISSYIYIGNAAEWTGNTQSYQIKNVVIGSPTIFISSLPPSVEIQIGERRKGFLRVFPSLISGIDCGNDDERVRETMMKE